MKSYIKNISIKNLFEKKNISWDLQDINVLVGDNGAGKSTILNIVREMSHADGAENISKASSSKITFTDDSFVESKEDIIKKSDLENFISLIEESLSKKQKINQIEKIDSLRKFLSSTRSDKSNPIITAKIGGVKFHKGKILNKISDIKTQYVSTINMNANSINEIKGSDGVTKTILDMEIQKEISIFNGYINDERYPLVKERLSRAINSFFKESGKSIEIKENISIKKSRSSRISLRNLSSGERQVIFIFLKVANSFFDGSIILMDEPEISLHLSWQEKLISQIRFLNPESQILIVTHSPAIVMNGWMDKFIDISDIEVKE
ncbi:AAA family ATPase [Gluconobacter kondonii]|uniref:AAA family ATPase n=1 Tax=Gluconobacter kondonii TaxID=941463 RepID=UPI00209DFF41|nr:AAA family ATPase [Gluconobacter kondonii]MCP1237697.1 AAA family ATPase [Gluconobacter kondonii]